MTRKGVVVVLDEDPSMRILVRRWLKAAGYAVLFDPGPGSRKPLPEPAVLVIADVAIPENAQVLIESMRAVYAAPVLAVSARFRRGLAGSQEAARRLGARRVLPKPFSRGELLCAVRESAKERSEQG